MRGLWLKGFGSSDGLFESRFPAAFSWEHLAAQHKQKSSVERENDKALRLGFGIFGLRVQDQAAYDAPQIMPLASGLGF